MTKDELIAKLVKALEPFAKAANAIDKEFHSEPDDSIYETVGPQIQRYGEWVDGPDCMPLTHGDFRAARQALSHASAAQSDEPDHIYDPSNWECTYSWEDREEMLVHLVTAVVEVATLYEGPRQFAARGADDNWHWFQSREEAEAAHKEYLRALNEDDEASSPPSKQEGK